MSWSQAIKDQCMIACGRSCCICHKPCGIKIEIHHIDLQAAGGANTFENAIPVCFDCHAEIGHYNNSHPKGTKYSSNELKIHRDNWYEKVKGTGATTVQKSIPSVDTRIFSDIHNGFVNLYLHFSESDVWPTVSYGLMQDLNHLSHKLRANAPDLQFTDSNLEQLKTEFSIHLREFRAGLSSLGVLDSHGDTMIFRVKPYKKVAQEAYDKIYARSQKCDDLADQAIESYQVFYKAARNSLGIDLPFSWIDRTKI